MKCCGWNAGMPSAPSVKRGFFPLDEELQLWAGHFTPSVYEGVTRWGTWMPFERAVTEMGYFWRGSVTEPTVRRTTEGAGAAEEQGGGRGEDAGPGHGGRTRTRERRAEAEEFGRLALVETHRRGTE